MEYSAGRESYSDWAVRFAGEKIGRADLVPSGFPLVIDLVSGAISELALLFLYERYVKLKIDKEVQNTLNSYAHDLKEWFQHLDKFELGWGEVIAEDIVGHAKVMRATVSPATGCIYATRTIKRRLSTVVSLYRWALKSRYKSMVSEAARESLEEVFSDPSSLYVQIQADEQQHVSLILPEQAKAILASLGKSASEMAALLPRKPWEQTTSATQLAIIGSSRNRLAAEISLKAGLRISEVCALKVSQFQDFVGREDLAETEVVKIKIKGKGGKTREADFSGDLIRQICEYINGERSCLQKILGMSTQKTLLLNPISSGKYAGSRTTPRTLQRAFAKACLAVGASNLVRVSTFNDSGKIAGSAPKLIPKFVFHDLRHTYAIWTYYARKKSGDSEPWLYIQRQLGHAHLDTTIRIYLAGTLEFEAHVSDVIMKKLNEKKEDFPLPATH